MPRTKKADKAPEKKQERQQTLALLNLPDGEWDENDPGQRDYIRRDKRGRPTVMTKQTLSKLRDAFLIGCPDEEACIYAGIGPATLYRYCKNNHDFDSEKEELKQAPILTARFTVVQAIKKSAPDAWEYLKRKRKKEFADMKIEAETEAISAAELEQLNNGDIKIIK